jgi:hypothetical protein
MGCDLGTCANGQLKNFGKVACLAAGGFSVFNGGTNVPINEPVLRVLGDVLDAEKKILALKAMADEVTGKPYVTTVLGNTEQLQESFAAAVSKYEELQAFLASTPLRIDADDDAAQAKMAKLAVEYAALQRMMNKAATTGLSDPQILTTIARISALDAAVHGLNDSLVETENVSRTLYASGGGWGGIGGKISLFGQDLGAGGANATLLNSISNLHLLLDLAIETAAVWIPATAAVGLWGVAASDAFTNAIHSASDFNTIIDSGLNATIPGLTNNMVHLRAEVAPQAYELFGDAMLVAGQKTGTFNTVVLGTGHVLDQLAARATAALTSGGMDTFARRAVSDVGMLGTAIGNLMGFIGNLIKSTPGIAQVLLDVGTRVLGLAEDITGSSIAQHILEVGMAFHGAFVYAGLAVTGLVALSRTFSNLIGEGSALEGALGWLRGGGFGALASNPYAWAAVGVGAITALVVALATMKDATERANSAQNASITSASSMAAGQYMLAHGIAATTSALHAQQAAYAAAPRPGGISTRFGGTPVQAGVNAYQDQGELNQLNAWSATYNAHMQDLAKSLGSVGNAQLFLNESGVTFKQMIQDQGSAWAQDKLQVLAVAEAYRALGYSQGVLGNDYQVLKGQQSDAYTAIQNINSAMSTWIGNVTGSLSAFDTFDQGLTTLKQNGDAVTLTLGKLTDKFTEGKAAIDGLTPSDIALNQAFQSQITNANALFATWRSAGLSANLFKEAIAASIMPMEKYARGSKSATAELVALAEEAGYTGPDNLARMNEYLGKTHDGLKAVQQASQQATIQEALLTGAMQAQGNMIYGQLSSALDTAEMKYSGVTGDVNTYAKALAQQGAGSTAAITAQHNLIDAIVKVGEHTHSTTAEIGAMISKLLDVPEHLAIQMVLNAEASISMSETVREYVSKGGNPRGEMRAGMATGGLVPHGFPHDTYLARLTSGEAVVPAHLTPAVAPFLAAHGVPGFAAGYVPPSMASHVSMGGENHFYNISVPDSADPHHAAKAIVAAVRKLKVTTGGQPTGIG